MIAPQFSRQTPLARFFADAYIPERIPQCPNSTRTEYARAIEHLGRYLDRPPLVDDLDKATLVAFRSWRLESPPLFRRAAGGSDEPSRSPAPPATPARRLSPATINKEIRTLQAIGRFAYDESLVDAPKRIAPVTEPRRQPEAYSIGDVARLLAAAAAEPGEIGAIPAGRWWWSLLAAAYDTGLRRGALLELRWRDVDLVRGLVTARAETQKTGADQVKDVHPETLEVLRSLAALQSGALPSALVWPWPKSAKRWYVALRRIIARAGLARPPRKPMHGLRASHATYLFDAEGLECARESCGHSSDRVTRRHYIDPRLTAATRVAAKLPRPEPQPPAFAPPAADPPAADGGAA